MIKNQKDEIQPFFNVKEIVSTYECIYILTSKGTLFAVDNFNQTYEIESPTPICQISSGEYFLILLSKDNKLLGYLERYPINVFMKENENRLFPISKVEFLTSTQESLPRNLNILFTKSGYQATFILMEDNSVYSFDHNNDKSILGRDGDVATPQMVKGDINKLKNEKIIKIEAGYDHVMYLSDQGIVYGNGTNVIELY